MKDGFVILGQFRGWFKTLQENPLGQSDQFPKDFTHNVRIYKGEITDSTFKPSYQPEEFQTLKSFEFLAVPNIEVNGNDKSAFVGKRVFTFTQLILVDHKIEKVYSINNQTYGEISGLVYGITEKNSEIDKINPNPVPPENDENRSQFGSNDIHFDSDFNNSGGLTRQGCLSSLLKFIGYLLLFLLLWWLIKACNAVSKDEGDCDRRDRNEIRLKRDIKIRDSLQKVFDANLPRALANIRNIYFYVDSDDIHEYSLGTKGSLERLIVLLKAYNERDFYVIGHIDSDEKNNDNEIDLAQVRVETVKNVFIENGVDENRLFDSIAGDKKANKSLPKYKFLFSDYTYREYNSNMRVEIKIKE